MPSVIKVLSSILFVAATLVIGCVLNVLYPIPFTQQHVFPEEMKGEWCSSWGGFETWTFKSNGVIDIGNSYREQQPIGEWQFEDDTLKTKMNNGQFFGTRDIKFKDDQLIIISRDIMNRTSVPTLSQYDQCIENSQSRRLRIKTKWSIKDPLWSLMFLYPIVEPNNRTARE